MLKLIRYASIGRQLGGLTERICDSFIHMGFNCLKARPVNVIQFYRRLGTSYRQFVVVIELHAFDKRL